MKYSRLLQFFLRLGVLSTQAQGSANQVTEAIAICREKLSTEPHFPAVQHSLAQLLDSQLSGVYDKPYNDVSQHDKDRISEVIGLYHAVGEPPAAVDEKKVPPPKVRYGSLARAGTISRDTLFDTPKAITYFLQAMAVEGIEDAMLISMFEQVMPLLLRKDVPIDDTTNVVIESSGNLRDILNDGTHLENYLKTALQLVEFASAKCPNESIIDEYKGATLRKLQQSNLAYKSYHDAMDKAKQQYYDAGKAEPEKLVTFIRTAILACAAGIEAGVDRDECLSFLIEADNASTQASSSFDNLNEINKFMLNEQLVELYNNMGIIEKKRRDYNMAYMYFKKALMNKPGDGHALVQLASIEDKAIGNDYSVVSRAKSLEAEYVSALFDGYSGRFETELVDTLHYRGHVFLFDAMKAALAKMKKSFSSVKQIVELGCGTGLLGDIIAKYIPTATLLGVDLSLRMVEASRERQTYKETNVYSNVAHGDAVQFLSTLNETSCDAILASDVFIYIGDLSEILKESYKSLVDSGIVAFTVESLEDSSSDSGLRLLKSGRFGHSKTYIERVAGEHGFKIYSWNDCVLRQQGGADVNGATVVLVKA